MKKILTALILLFSLASCEKASDGNQVTISKDEYQKLKFEQLMQNLVVQQEALPWVVLLGL